MLLGGAVNGGRVVADWPGLIDRSALREPRPQADDGPRCLDRRRAGAAFWPRSGAGDGDTLPRNPRDCLRAIADHRLTFKRLYFLNFSPRWSTRGVFEDDCELVRATCTDGERSGQRGGAGRTADRDAPAQCGKRAAGLYSVRQFGTAAGRPRSVQPRGQRSGSRPAAVDKGALVPTTASFGLVS